MISSAPDGTRVKRRFNEIAGPSRGAPTRRGRQ
jgi:hypothetical protein